MNSPRLAHRLRCLAQCEIRTRTELVAKGVSVADIENELEDVTVMKNAARECIAAGDLEEADTCAENALAMAETIQRIVRRGDAV